jgi:hypothetical protein
LSPAHLCPPSIIPRFNELTDELLQTGLYPLDPSQIPDAAKRRPTCALPPAPGLPAAAAPLVPAYAVDVPAGDVPFRQPPHTHMVSGQTLVPVLPAGVVDKLPSGKPRQPTLPRGHHEITGPVALMHIVQRAEQKKAAAVLKLQKQKATAEKKAAAEVKKKQIAESKEEKKHAVEVDQRYRDANAEWFPDADDDDEPSPPRRHRKKRRLGLDYELAGDEYADLEQEPEERDV